MKSFNAEFVNIKPIRSRSVYQIVLEVTEEMGDAALQKLGGLPRSGESRYVIVAMPEVDGDA